MVVFEDKPLVNNLCRGSRHSLAHSDGFLGVLYARSPFNFIKVVKIVADSVLKLFLLMFRLKRINELCITNNSGHLLVRGVALGVENRHHHPQHGKKLLFCFRRNLIQNFSVEDVNVVVLADMVDLKFFPL